MADVADANTVELQEAKRERSGSEVYMKQEEDGLEIGDPSA